MSADLYDRLTISGINSHLIDQFMAPGVPKQWSESNRVRIRRD